MATLSVTSWFEPKNRDKTMIIKGLMGLAPDNKAETGQEQSPNDNRWHQDIHRRAFLADQDKTVDYGIRQIKAMMKHPQSRFVVPVDGGNGLEGRNIQSTSFINEGIKEP